MLRRHVVAAAALVLVAGCASTTVRDSWRDPDYRGPAFRKVLVLGVSSDLADRRLFEDIMAQRVSAAGAEGLPAYRFLPEGGKVAEAELERAVKASGADALLMSRIRQVDRRTQVTTQMVPAGMGPGFGPWGPGWYGMYAGWYPVTDVRQYDIAVIETSLFDTAPRKLVWAGTTETYEPRSVQQDAPGFADVIVKALAGLGLLPGKP